MQKFNQKKYPFKSKKDILNSLKDIILPLDAYFVRNNTRVHISNTGTNDSVQDLTDFEHFSRILWGLIPAGNSPCFDGIWDRVYDGIKNGVNSESNDYFGDPADYSQILVEMAAYAYGLIISKEKFWEPLNTNTKKNLVQWLKKANDCKYHNCNWKFFNILVNLGLKSIGEDTDSEKMNKYLDDIEKYYFKDGWYFDGEIGKSHSDYYVAFAIHFYSLIYIKVMREAEPERCEIYAERAKKFAQSFIYWFAEDGSAIPYGRSLNYRFAQVSFFCAAVYANVDLGFDSGTIKGVILRHFRYWFTQPIFNAAGHLVLGYTYTNMNFPEGYMAPGSTYWALKAYLILALEDNHDFWKSEEKPLPKFKNNIEIDAPFLKIIRNDRSSQIIAYNGGNYHSNDHNHVEAKYEKFAYSNIFGISVSRGNTRLRHGAYDNMLAVADEYGYYRAKQKSTVRKMFQDYIYTKWTPYNYVNIDTYIITGNPWHIRVHVVDNFQDIDVADGGFALGLEIINKNKQKIVYKESKEGIIAVGENAYSAIFNMHGYDEADFVHPSGNTNSHNPMTVLPTLKKHLQKGKHILASYIVGDLHSNTDYTIYTMPKICFMEKTIEIIADDRTISIEIEK